MDIIKILAEIYYNMDLSTGYIYNDRTMGIRYIQDNKITQVKHLYFDLKDGQFISRDTIRLNQQILYKLEEYRNEHLVCFDMRKNGWFVRVYNSYGHLVYQNTIRVYDKVGVFQMFRLRRKFQNLALNRKF